LGHPLLAAAFLFAFILLAPTVRYLGSTRVPPSLAAVILFVAFDVASFIFCGYFRFGPARRRIDAAE
jgi:hypothetical protein